MIDYVIVPCRREHLVASDNTSRLGRQRSGKAYMGAAHLCLVERGDNFKIRGISSGSHHCIATYSPYHSGASVHRCRLELVRFRQAEFDVDLLR